MSRLDAGECGCLRAVARCWEDKGLNDEPASIMGGST